MVDEVLAAQGCWLIICLVPFHVVFIPTEVVDFAFDVDLVGPLIRQQFKGFLAPGALDNYALPKGTCGDLCLMHKVLGDRL